MFGWMMGLSLLLEIYWQCQWKKNDGDHCCRQMWRVKPKLSQSYKPCVRKFRWLFPKNGFIWNYNGFKIQPRRWLTRSWHRLRFWTVVISCHTMSIHNIYIYYIPWYDDLLEHTRTYCYDVVRMQCTAGVLIHGSLSFWIRLTVVRVFWDRISRVLSQTAQRRGGCCPVVKLPLRHTDLRKLKYLATASSTQHLTSGLAVTSCRKKMHFTPGYVSHLETPNMCLWVHW